MADGRLRRAADLVLGDRVYGTSLSQRRHYAHTTVKGHVVTPARGYRVKLSDGTELVSGPDQCFLTYRGWKHVTGTEQGRSRRPHLTRNAKLIGTGQFDPGTEEADDYRRGYLCGLIRGDGHVGSYLCTPAGKPPWIKHGFRLALADHEALQRARTYLADAGVRVKEFAFQPATPRHRAINALGNQTRDGVNLVRAIIEWPATPSVAWRLGFLAGIFDAEGSCQRGGTIRICNTNPTILDTTERSLRHFGFDVTRDTTSDKNGRAYIRIRGGLRERLRFFHSTDPAISRKRNFASRALYSDADLRVVSIEPLNKTLPLHHVTTTSGDLVVDGVIASAGLAP